MSSEHEMDSVKETINDDDNDT